MSDACTVYQYFAANGALLYVGITGRGLRRSREHAESKEWWQLSTGCTLEHYDNRDAALARESYLIKTFRPPWNKQQNPDRNKPLSERRSSIGPKATPIGPKVLSEMPSTAGRSTLLPQATVSDRRRAWHELPPELRRVAPCVECAQRPGTRGPACINCLERRRERAGLPPGGVGRSRRADRDPESPDVAAAQLLGVTVKELRTGWYQQTKETGTPAPCIACADSPGQNGPLCRSCLKARAEILARRRNRSEAVAPRTA